MANRTLNAVDYVLLVILLLASAVIGVIFGFVKSRKNSAQEFLLADGGMGIFPTALSIMVSFLSAVTILGTPSEIYVYGTMYFYQVISWTLSSTISALVFMPKFREMGHTSAYEYLEERFNRVVRICASVTFSIYMLIYMAIVLYAPALALSETTGLNIWLSVFSIGIVCTFYSSVGGMKAIIWTDVLQGLVMFMGLFAALIQGLIKLGGFGPAFSIASDGGRIIFNSISPDPRVRHTIWSLLIGGTMNSLTTYGFNQTQVQRYMCVRSTRGAKYALFINAVGAALIILLSCLIGVVIYAYYAGCDPYTRKEISEVDQIFPYFVMEVFEDRPGLPGVFLACVFSGSLSTISSGLNSLAAVLVEDIYKGLFGRTLTDRRQGLISKILSVALGAVVMLLTYVVSYLGSILNAALSIGGTLQGPIMGVFVLGFLFPCANKYGAFVGFISSLIFQLWINIGAQVTKNQMVSEALELSVANCTIPYNLTITTASPLKKDPLLDLYSVSYMWYPPIGVLTVLLVGIIVSLLTHSFDSNRVDRKLIIPIGDGLCCCIPKRIRQWLGCSVNDENDFDNRKNNGAIKKTTIRKLLFRSNKLSPISSATKEIQSS